MARDSRGGDRVARLKDALRKTAGMDPREARLVRALNDEDDARISARTFETILARVGLAPDDARLTESMAALRNATTPDAAQEEARLRVDHAAFCDAIRPNILLIERALQGRMVIPDFAGFGQEIAKIYEAVRRHRDGTPADYIPQLNLTGEEADHFAVALCTVDGQRMALGDAERFFTVQSTTKTVSYCIALEEHGPDVVHHYIGREPSGASFNELTLNKRDQPHNPMINAGAILCSALIGHNDRGAADGGAASGDQRGLGGRRFDRVVSYWRALCGGEEPRFSTAVFLSERETADRNFALAYMMRERGGFPEGSDLHDVLEFYFQTCSIELNARMMSVVAGTLANGGICPVTGKRVFATETVRNCLSMMAGCGMYDYSGEFAFKIGLPAKSGVSGAVMVVVPNVVGFCTYSPRLDALGNSVRGVEFFERLVATFNFHHFDNLTGSSTKRDPRLDPMQLKVRRINEMIWAASKGDVGAMQDLVLHGAAWNCADYDLRTPLHLAAAENQAQVVRHYIELHAAGEAPVALSPRDRWGGTPLDDARRQGHDEIVALLRAAGARSGDIQSREPKPATATPLDEGHGPGRADELIWAASMGNMEAVRRLVAQGVPLDMADYDDRTPLHLAAAEGHAQIVTYLLRHGVPVDPRDRWGDTPLDEARRHGHAAVADTLAARGATASSAAGGSRKSPDRRKAA